MNDKQIGALKLRILNNDRRVITTSRSVSTTVFLLEETMNTVLPIFCLGGNPDLALYAKQAGWGYGLRSDYTPYAAPCFVDYPFKRGGGYWPNHLAKVREWMPAVAAVPDLEHPDQLTSVLHQCDELRALGIRPMVIPKYRGAVEDAPKDALIGISVKSRYAGFHYDETKLVGRDVHLLGADVVKQAPHFRKYTAWGARVVSIDSNTMQEKAQKRGAYFGKNTRNLYRWLDHRPRRDNDELFIWSLEGIKAYWHQLATVAATHQQQVMIAA